MFAVLDPMTPVVLFSVNVFGMPDTSVMPKVELMLKLPLPAFPNPVTPEIVTVSRLLRPGGRAPVVVTVMALSRCC